MDIKRKVLKRKILPIVVIILTLISTFYYVKNEFRGKKNKKTQVFPEPQTDTSYAKIGVYIKGNFVNFKKLLRKYGIATTPISYNLEYFRGPDVELNNVLDLLVFTTEGLSGVHSASIKRKLERFVRKGGNLLVLSQEYGYDYSVLPGSIDGYGWKEDEQHRKRWAYINRNHPVFSGQDDIILKCRIDGYLTVFPFYSEVLLIRSENLMPALITYRYGLGNVMVTTLYPDYGFKVNKITNDELILFRDLLTWAMNPDLQFKYVKSGTHVEIPVRIKNFSDTVLNVEKAVLKVYTPNKQLYSTGEVTLSTKLQKEHFIREYWEAENLSDVRGIWMINYTLFNRAGSLLQHEKTGTIFAPEKDIRSGKMKLGDLQMRVWPSYKEKRGVLSEVDLALINKSDSVFRGKVMITNKGLNKFVDSIKPVIIKQDSGINLKFPLTSEIRKMEGLFFLLFGEEQNIKTSQSAICKFWLGLNPPAKFKKKYDYIDINRIQDTITKTVKMPKNQYKMYIDECVPDKNEYILGDTIRLKVKIHTDSDSKIKVVVSSRSPISDTFFIGVSRKSDNRFEIKYPTAGMKRGQNSINLSLNCDSNFIAGEYLLISLNVPDTIPPIIDITKLPENTHSCLRYKLRARILNPGSDPTPIYDTLYYRFASVGGSRWNQLQRWLSKGDTFEYLLPAQAGGTHVQCHLVVKDSMGNVARYPFRGEINYWVLPTLKPIIEGVKVNKDTTVSIRWTPPKQLFSTHCGLSSDTVFLGEKKVASRFIPQYLPARLSRVTINFACNEEESINLKVHKVEDSLPGKVIYQSSYKIKRGENELKIPNINVPGEGVFVSIEGSTNTGVVFDGFGQGLNTAVYHKNSWTFNTSGEAWIRVLFEYKPSKDSSRMKGLQSKVLPFEVYRKSVNEEWTKISGEVYDTTYTDTSINYDKRYFYKIKCKYSNPPYSIFSKKEIISIDKSSIQD